MKKSVTLRVLAYHKVQNCFQFEKQLKHLKAHYNIIEYRELFEALYKEKSLPKNPVLITFDDGDLSNYKNAYPYLLKYKASAVFFIITNLINTNDPFWWDEIEYYQGKESGDKKVWEVKNWDNKKRELYLEELRKKSDKPPMIYSQLTTSDLEEMCNNRMTIANHSHTHPMFNNCTFEELDEELESSISILEDLKFTSRAFAYPNGNFSDKAEKKLKEHGIKLAFLFDHKINRGHLNPLRISRLIVNDTTPIWKLKFILSGWHSKILPLTRALGKLRK
ncbi:polysaccharide deacetylase family protein [Salegentibacter chungangensis]|uniref:Polysaccharide deacetylase family protein n=1 Tax=Salegentibacter chungangensis TaxID=1335724 RepID=A0ABW3NR65_9FLAO